MASFRRTCLVYYGWLTQRHDAIMKCSSLDNEQHYQARQNLSCSWTPFNKSVKLLVAVRRRPCAYKQNTLHWLVIFVGKKKFFLSKSFMILRNIYISWCREISRTALATDPQTKMQHYLIRFLTVSARLRERYILVTRAILRVSKSI